LHKKEDERTYTIIGAAIKVQSTNFIDPPVTARPKRVGYPYEIEKKGAFHGTGAD